MVEIFISYKREERDIARLLAGALEAEGWTVWWDPKLRAGEYFDDIIEGAIKNAKCVIVLWSARSAKSRYVKDEASYALNLGKLVPVAIDNTQAPFRFQGLHTIQLQGWGGSARHPAFQGLVKDIKEKLGRPVTPTMKNEQQQPEMLDEPEAVQSVRRSREKPLKTSAIPDPAPTTAPPFSAPMAVDHLLKTDSSLAAVSAHFRNDPSFKVDSDHLMNDPSLSSEEKVSHLMYLTIKEMDKVIERQTLYINSLQQQSSPGQSIDVEVLKKKRLIDKKSQVIDDMRQIIDKYNQKARDIIDTMSR